MHRLAPALALAAACVSSGAARGPATAALDLAPSPRAPAIDAGADPDDPCASPRCATTGAAARLSFDDRRGAALALFERYRAAVSARSVEGLRAALGDVVTGVAAGAVANGVPASREAVVMLHERLFELMDARGFEATEVRALSWEECRAQPCAASPRPGDFLVTWRTTSFRASPVPGAAVAPTQMLVRWSAGAPRVVALSDAFLTRRPP